MEPEALSEVSNGEPMTWHGWLVLLCEFGALVLLLLAWLDERAMAKAVIGVLTAERDQARSDLDFTTEVLSDVAADRARLQDQVLSLQTRLRVHDLRRWGADRFGLN